MHRESTKSLIVAELKVMQLAKLFANMRGKSCACVFIQTCLILFGKSVSVLTFANVESSLQTGTCTNILKLLCSNNGPRSTRRVRSDQIDPTPGGLRSCQRGTI